MDISNLTAASAPPVLYTPALKSAVSTPAVSAPASSSASASNVKQAMDEINAQLSETNQGRDLNFSVDQDTGMTVVRIVNSATKELITQFPAEVVVRIAHALSQYKGAVFNESA